MSSSATISEVYVPVQNTWKDKIGKDKDFAAVVITTDPKIIATCKEMETLDEHNQDKWGEQNITRLLVEKDIIGMIRSDNLGTWAKRGVAQLQDITTPDCILIEENASPNFWQGLIGVAVGILIFIFTGLYWLVVLMTSKSDPSSTPLRHDEPPNSPAP